MMVYRKFKYFHWTSKPGISGYAYDWSRIKWLKMSFACQF